MIRRYRSRVFYGYWMVGAAFGVQLITAGLLFQSFGAYVAVLQDEMGWSRTALAGAFSLTQFISGVIGPFQGVVMDRIGPRGVMRVGFVFFGVGFMLLSQVNSLTGYYAAFVIIALGFALSAFFPLTVALVNWFERHRSRVLSLMSLGFAVGGLIVPLVALSLEEFGWRNTAFGSGVIMIAAGIPLASVMRHRPEDYGEVVDGIRTTPEADEKEEEEHKPTPLSSKQRDFTAREAMRTPAFWLISLGRGAALLVVGAVSVHVVSHLKEDLGYSVGTAALVVTLMTMMQVVGLIIGGAIGDRYDKRIISATCMVAHMMGLPAGYLRDGLHNGRRFRRAARFGLGCPRPADAGDTSRLLWPHPLRHDHGHFDNDHHGRPDHRAVSCRHHGRHNRQLRGRLHDSRCAGGPWFVVLPLRSPTQLAGAEHHSLP